MVENVNENVDSPRIGVAKIAVAYGPAASFAEEPEHIGQPVDAAAGIVIRECTPMPGAGKLKRQGNLLSVCAKKSAPEPGENEGSHVQVVRLVALDEGEDLHFG